MGIKRRFLKRIVSIFLIALVIISVVCNDVGVWAKGTRPQNSAYLLEGKSIVITVFIKDGKNSFSKKSKEKDLERIGVATDYMMDVAYTFGKDSELITGSFDENNDLVYEISCKNACERAELAAELSGRLELQKEITKKVKNKVPINKLLKKYNTDSYVFCFIFPELSRCYQSSFGDDNYNEAIYLFSNVRAGTIAHEMLHSFGAIDLYYNENDWKDGKQSAAQKKKELSEKIAEEYSHPQALFLGNCTEMDYVNDAVISDLNLYYLGLTDNRDAMKKKYPMAEFPKEKGVN